MLTISEPRVIKTDAQYREYLSEVGQLMALDPELTSPEGKRLELFALLVETYEKEHHRIPPPNPVDAILFRLEQQGLQQKDLVPLIGSKGRVSEVLSGKRRLTVPMLEAEPPLAVVREIVKRGWVEGGKVTAKNASEFVEQLLHKVGVSEPRPAYLRSSIHAGIAGHVNLYAIKLWIAEVLIRSREQDVKRGLFKRENFRAETLGELARLVEYLSKLGIAVVWEPHLPGTRLDGAAVLDRDGTPVIGLTLRHDRLDNFWFTLLHECVHIMRHLHTPGETFVDDTERPFDTDEKEIEANRLARDSLIPQEAWRHSDANRLKTPEAINALATDLKIHPAIVAGRIRREAGNYKLFSSMVGHRAVKKVLNA
jgi:HTH-type transcriptional regulator/antitoxin HigA